MTIMKPQNYLLIFLGFFSLALGYESGKEYVYKYVVRSVSGINVMNERNAVIEFQSRVIVQSVDAYTLIIRFSDNHITQSGKYQANVYNTDEDFDGSEDLIADYEYEFLSAPFSVSHNKGSITGIKIGADENQWIVNLKKSFASQLQLDATGSRSDSSRSYKQSYNDNEPDSFIVFEDFINGRCRTKVEITQLPVSQIYSSKTGNLDAYKTTCRDNQVYGIVKTTDFNRCKTNRFWDSSSSNDYASDFDNDNFSKRNLVSKYMACGKSLSELTVIQGETYSSLAAQPFNGRVDWNMKNELVNFVITNMELEQVKEISYSFKVGTYTKEHKSLAHDLNFFEQWKQYGSRDQFNDFDSYNQWKRNSRAKSNDFDQFSQWKRRRDQLHDFDTYNQWKRRSQPNDFDNFSQGRRRRNQLNDFDSYNQRKRCPLGDDFDSFNQ